MSNFWVGLLFVLGVLAAGAAGILLAAALHHLSWRSQGHDFHLMPGGCRFPSLRL